MSETAMLSANGPINEDAIAIIGVATQLAQEADSYNNLWKFLLQGKNAMTPFPPERVNHQSHYHPNADHGGTFVSKGFNFLSADPFDFDFQFFRMTKTEVMIMDPQQRLLLENVYQALENAGIPLENAVSSMTSVFVGSLNYEYQRILGDDPELCDSHVNTGGALSILANRISWFYDFKASSISVDTACSSSLVSLHLACRDLQNKESNMAVVSGVNVLLSAKNCAEMSRQGFLSPDGKSYSFDHRANGYARGEGVGTVILKRVSDAIRDGNTIRAIIRGTGLNQDGRTPGITLPNGDSQVALIRAVYEKAGLDPEETLFIESHGTGTPAGDPIEARAISRGFNTVAREDPLVIGSVKSGLGHTEGAAGIVGVIKAVMVLESGIIPPNANFEKANPKIPAEKWKLVFPKKAIPWPSKGRRRISVSSMGFGGTNAHAILDDALSFLQSCGLAGTHRTLGIVPSEVEIQNIVTRDQQENNAGSTTFSESNYKEEGHDKTDPENKKNGDMPDTPKPLVFLISAFDEKGILRNADCLSTHIKLLPSRCEAAEEEYRQDLSFTLCERRTKFHWRTFCIATTLDDLTSKLEQHKFPNPVQVRQNLAVGFVFSGQGAQWYAMGRELMVYPAYKHSLVAADSYMKRLGSTWSLMDELLQEKGGSSINRPDIAQTACTALQVAAVDLLASWGVFPDRVVGHSSGEIAAAFSAKKIGRMSAWKLAFFRGVVSSIPHYPKGAMLAVGLCESDLASYLERVHEALPGELVVACYNSRNNLTISGDEAKIDALKQLLDLDSVFSRKLNVPVAYHSNHMKAAAEKYMKLLGDIKSEDKVESPKDTKMFSSVHNRLVESEELESAEYWVANLKSPVRFSQGFADMCFRAASEGQKPVSMNSSAENTFVHDVVEIGPHGAMQSAIRQTLEEYAATTSINYFSILDRRNPGLDSILTTVASLNSKGHNVNVLAMNASQNLTQPNMLVDLPPYHFNHETRCSRERRITRNFNLKKGPRSDLLGTRVEDWNPEEPRWRYMVRLVDNPWLRDHVISGGYIYPGAGFVTMAIEAAKQISNSDVDITGFRLKDVSIKTALHVPDTKEGVETSISMSRRDESQQKRPEQWWHFRIWSFDSTAEEWIEHCSGDITVETAPANANLIDNGSEAEQESIIWQDAFKNACDACHEPLEYSEIYGKLDSIGVRFGANFQNLSNIKVTPGLNKATGVVSIPNISESMPYGFMSPHVIHPSTLDGFFHLMFSAIFASGEDSPLSAPLVPTRISELWIASTMISDPGKTFFGISNSKSIGPLKYQSDITFWDEKTQQRVASLNGLVMSRISQSFSQDTSTHDYCYTIEWKPDIDFLKPDRIPNRAFASSEELADRRSKFEDNQLGAMLLIVDALRGLEDVSKESYRGHFQKYYEWMLQKVEILQSNSMIHLPLEKWLKCKDDLLYREQLFHRLRETSEGAVLLRMGTNIEKVLRNEVDPLHLMFGIDNALDRFYTDSVTRGDIGSFADVYADIIGHSWADIRILEVGAGTGAWTSFFLTRLGGRGGNESRIAQYTFTDMSPAFFEKAQTRFNEWASILDFRVLDIERHPLEQGFEESRYDIIVAGAVLHATSDLLRTLENIRYLLKPGGKLYMGESLRGEFLTLPLSFGQLEGWWLGTEDDRKWYPGVDETTWDRLLRKAGFSGVDINARDYQTPDLQGDSVIISTAIDSQALNLRIPAEILVITEEADETALARVLVKEIACKYALKNCSVLNCKETFDKNLKDTLCISLIELNRALFANPTDDEFKAIQYLFVNCENLLWVTGDTIVCPELNSLYGLMRSVRWERDLEKPNLVTLSISDPRPSLNTLIQTILEISEYQFMNGSAKKSNNEYLLQDSVILTNRLVKPPRLNQYLNEKFSNATSKLMTLSEAEAARPLRLRMNTPGLLNELLFETDSVWYEPLENFDVEVKVKSVGLNFRDIMVAMGEIHGTDLGFEGAGIVTRVGASVTKVQAGQRVLFMEGRTGAFYTYARTIEDFVQELPDEMTFEVAAAFGVVSATAMYALYTVANLTMGETVLIHSAAGGVGQAAIMLATNIGAEVFATVSTPEKAELLIKTYSVKRDHIFSSRDLLFAKGIMRMTKGKGVDVVLNSLSGEFLRRTWDCIAPFGRFIEIGKTDTINNSRISMAPFLRNATMASVHLDQMMQMQPKRYSKTMSEVTLLFKEGKIHVPSPITIFDYSKLETALRALQSGKSMGKIVLIPTEDAIVPVIPPRPAPLKLDKDASYVLSGGLGGVGRNLALWMVSKGARNLIFLSRSEATSPEAQSMINEFRSQGITTLSLCCDVSEKSSLEAALEQCEATLPPIKGCIQAAMVLRDKMFENMTFEEYQAALRPKIQGSRNLHTCLPKNMDFFVLLSSLTSVSGNRGQVNYAAGNSYQDGLAAHRRSLGLPGLSINLGLLLSIGHIAEHGENYDLSRLKATIPTMSEKDLHGVLEYYLAPSVSSNAPAQVVFGVSQGKVFTTRGIPIPSWMNYPLSTHIASTTSAIHQQTDDDNTDSGIKITSTLSFATSMLAAATFLENAICVKLSKLLGISVKDIDPTKSVSNNGIDSLVAMELRTWAVNVVAADISLLEILSPMPIAGATGLSMRLARASKLVPDSLRTKNPEE